MLSNSHTNVLIDDLFDVVPDILSTRFTAANNIPFLDNFECIFWFDIIQYILYCKRFYARYNKQNQAKTFYNEHLCLQKFGVSLE